MGLMIKLANRLLAAFYHKEARQFMADLVKIEQVQEQLLLEILTMNKDTEYGRKYNFAKIKNIAQFRANVPISSYTDYLPYIELQKSGRNNILTDEKVKMFELSGGSSGSCKLIPYTLSLKQQFLAGIKPWIYQLYKTYPQLKDGKSYWSITPPAIEKHYTEGGIAIGFEDDTAYFGKFEQFLTNLLFIRAKNIDFGDTTEQFYQKTALALLSDCNLALISVWNPSYLLILLDYISKNQQELLILLPPKRRQEIAQYLKDDQFHLIWPKLSLISCWADHLACESYQKLQKMLPDINFQPKGILATEAFISLPYRQTGFSILSYKSHFFEFIDVVTNKIHIYTELKLHQKYEIIFTTGGGFYRYRINDCVLVADLSEEGLPLLQFCGKTDKTADYHGEKLNELFIAHILEQINTQENASTNYNLANRFKLFAYQDQAYILFLANCKYAQKADYYLLANQLEEHLLASYHYRLCRRLGQLQASQICLIEGDYQQDYINFYQAKGRKLGDIKPELLSLETNWINTFKIIGTFKANTTN